MAGRAQLTKSGLVGDNMSGCQGNVTGEALWAFVNCQEGTKPVASPMLYGSQQGYIASVGRDYKPYSLARPSKEPCVREHQADGLTCLPETRRCQWQSTGVAGSEKGKIDVGISAYMALQNTSVGIALIRGWPAEVYSPGGIACAVPILPTRITKRGSTYSGRKVYL